MKLENIIFNMKDGCQIENFIINNSRLKLAFSDIEQAISEYCELIKISDPNEFSSQQFSGMCNYIGNKFFKNSGCLLCHEIIRYTKYPTSGYMLIPALIERLLDCFIFLCQRYSKKITAYNFSLFCGIDQNTFSEWGNNDEIYNLNDIQNNVIFDKDNNIYIDLNSVKQQKYLIVKRLYDSANESYFNDLGDNKSPIALIQYGRSKGFISAMDDTRNSMQIKLSLSASDLPKLSG